MIRTLVLIASLAAAAHGGWSWDTQSVLVRFEYTLTGIGTDAFIAMPVYLDNATAKGWMEFARPTGPDGYSSLVMLCPGAEDDYDLTVCALYDDTGFMGGLQIAVDQEYVSNPAYDWAQQGFTEWAVTLPNGTAKAYWSRQQYYISTEMLASSAESRVASRDPTTILQDDNIWVTGPKAELYNISTNTDYITGTDSVYTEQSCIPWMGRHYYYNMTTSLDCLDDTIFGWFPLVYSNRLIGVGTMMFLQYSAGNNYFEHPSKSEVQLIVPTGPDCLYNLADTPGVLTLHTYFVDPAWTISCVVEDS